MGGGESREERERQPVIMLYPQPTQSYPVTYAPSIKYVPQYIPQYVSQTVCRPYVPQTRTYPIAQTSYRYIC